DRRKLPVRWLAASACANRLRVRRCGRRWARHRSGSEIVEGHPGVRDARRSRPIRRDEPAALRASRGGGLLLGLEPREEGLGVPPRILGEHGGNEGERDGDQGCYDGTHGGSIVSIYGSRSANVYPIDGSIQALPTRSCIFRPVWASKQCN